MKIRIYLFIYLFELCENIESYNIRYKHKKILTTFSLAFGNHLSYIFCRLKFLDSMNSTMQINMCIRNLKILQSNLKNIRIQMYAFFNLNY